MKTYLASLIIIIGILLIYIGIIITMKEFCKLDFNNLTLRRFQGAISQFLYPSFSKCQRCNRVWAICKEHNISYTPNNSRLCFALCEKCWSELTPVERLPYYNKLINEWQSLGGEDHNDISWEDIRSRLRKNILAGS